MPPQATPVTRPAQASTPAKSTSAPAAATKTTPTPAANKTTSTPAANKSTSTPASTSGSGSSAAAATQEDVMFDKEQVRKENVMQAHWLQWSSIADTDRSYIVVFDQSSPAITAELKRIAPNAKLDTMPQVHGFLDFIIKPSKVGNVQAATVDAATYSQIMEKFDFKRITVKVGTKNRTGFVPIARSTDNSEETPAKATPAATGAGNASKTSNTAGASAGGGNATKTGGAGAGNAASKTGTAGAAKGGNAGGATAASKAGTASGTVSKASAGTAGTNGTAAKGKGTDRS